MKESLAREGPRILEEQEKARAGQLAEFRAEADRRLASPDRGEGIEGEVVFARIREKSDRLRRERA